VLADAPGEGEQNSARPVTFADGRRLLVWLSNTTGVFLPVAQFD
jgi:uracil-DNA glycosylase